jgi:hypothetical protein
MIHQIPESEYSGPALTEGACLFLTPESISIGKPVEWDCYDDDGLGPARIAVFQTDDGLLFSLQHHEFSPHRDLMTLFVSPGDLASHVDSVLVALRLTSADLGWLAEGVCLRACRLIRQDDNGVHFHVGDFPCRADAEAMSTQLSAGAHKQTFFVESILDGGPRLKFPEDYSSPPSVIPG